MGTNIKEGKSRFKAFRQDGMGLFGVIFLVGLIVGIAFLILNVYPVLSEKMKVDLVMESLVSNPSATSMNIQGIATSIEKQLSINYVTSLNRKNILKALTVKNGTEGKKVIFQYTIQRKLLERWTILYDYEKVVLISRKAL